MLKVGKQYLQVKQIGARENNLQAGNDKADSLIWFLALRNCIKFLSILQSLMLAAVIHLHIKQRLRIENISMVVFQEDFKKSAIGIRPKFIDVVHNYIFKYKIHALETTK